MGVYHPNIPGMAYVVDFGSDGGGTFITISNVPTASAAGASIELSCSNNATFGIGQNSFLLNNNPGRPGGPVVYTRGRPATLMGFFGCDEVSSVNWGSLFFELQLTHAHSVTFADTESFNITVDSSAQVLPGYYAHSTCLRAGTKVVSISGTTITLDTKPIADTTSASILFAKQASVLGPKAMVNANSYVRVPMRKLENLPGVTPTLDLTGSGGGGRGTVSNGGYLDGLGAVPLISVDGNYVAEGEMRAGTLKSDGGLTMQGDLTLSTAAGNRIYLQRAGASQYSSLRTTAGGDILAALGNPAADAGGWLYNGDFRLGNGAAKATSDVAGFPLVPGTAQFMTSTPTNADAARIPMVVNSSFGMPFFYANGKWVDPSAGRRIPTYETNKFYDGVYIPMNSSATLAMAANVLYLVPFRIRARSPWASVAAHVQAAGASGTNVRMGIFSVDANARYPVTLVADAGEIAATTTGPKEKAFASTLTTNPGEYWLGIVSNAAVTIYAGAAGPELISRLGGSGGPAASTDLQISIAHTYGPLPATVGTITRANGVLPNLALKAA